MANMPIFGPLQNYDPYYLQTMKWHNGIYQGSGQDKIKSITMPQGTLEEIYFLFVQLNPWSQENFAPICFVTKDKNFTNQSNESVVFIELYRNFSVYRQFNEYGLWYSYIAFGRPYNPANSGEPT